MCYKFKWDSIYKKAREMIRPVDNGTPMIECKDYEIVSQVHTEREIITTCRGIGNYCGKFKAVLKIKEEGDSLYLTNDCETVEIKPQGWPIPDKVLIGDALYKVERTYAKMHKPTTLRLGICNYDDQRIEVAQIDNADLERSIFIHEVVHGIIHQFCEKWKGESLSHDEEEKFVEAFSRGLYRVMKDNPNIFTEKDKV